MGHTYICRHTPIIKNYFFSGAGAAFSGAGAAFSGAGAAFSGAGAGSAGLASSFGAGFGGSADGPQPTNEKLAKNVRAINNTKSFFIKFHLLSLFIKYYYNLSHK
jgi:hypothetical protein